MVLVLGAREWPIVLWSLDPEDWRYRNANTVYRRVIAGTQRGIVLLHDIHATTVAAVPRILPRLEAEPARAPVAVRDQAGERRDRDLGRGT